MARKTDTPAEGQTIDAEVAELGSEYAMFLGGESVTDDALEAQAAPQYPQHAHISEFAASEPYIQAAIAELMAAAPRNDDGTLTVYPARDAWIDGEPRSVHPVTEDRAVFLLCHVPPPFYLSEDAARAGHVLADRPTA